MVDNWKLDAMQEHEAYFYNTSAVNELLTGKKCYVIGRKGIGKSAICQHIVTKKGYKHFATKLTFKDFPFNEMYKLEDKTYTSPNQYITLWKYLIYISVCRMMIGNNAITSSVREKLEKLFPESRLELLQYNLRTWTSSSFNLSILGCGGGWSGENEMGERPNWIDCCRILESFILDNAGTANYFVVFDELDESYSSVLTSDYKDKYIPLLTSLFKACQSVRSTFKSLPLNIRPVIFLRDDIYNQIYDSDKNKWSDFRIDLKWDTDTLKAMIAHRISVDCNIIGRPLLFDSAWSKLFSPNMLLSYGNKRRSKTDAFRYIERNTLLRPRDFISYITTASNLAITRQKNIISKDVITDVDKKYSDYLLSEIIDEVTPVLFDCKKILRIFSNTHKWNMTVEEFQKEFEQAIEDGEIEPQLSYIKTLETLFDFSIIGNEHRRQSGLFFFKYQDSSCNFNKRENIVLHRGLFKALQVI